VASVEVRKWKGVTLEDRSLHEITIVNNNNTAKAIKFSSIYSLPDSDSIDEQEVLLGPQDLRTSTAQHHWWRIT
jgi:hypothetical protein